MLSILIGVVAIFAFGAFWFTVLFGRKWAALMGFTADKMTAEEQAEAKSMGMVKPLVLNFLSNVIFVSVVYCLYTTQLFTFSYGEFMKIILVIWLGFTFPVYANYAVWERKSWTLVLLNSTQSLIALFITTLIIYFLS